MCTIPSSKSYRIRCALLGEYSRLESALRHRRCLTVDEVTSASNAIAQAHRYGHYDIHASLLSLFKPSDSGSLYSKQKLSGKAATAAFASLFN